jgi:putative redox protein
MTPEPGVRGPESTEAERRGLDGRRIDEVEREHRFSLGYIATMNSDDVHLATVHLDSGNAPYAQTIRAGRHTLAADEPAALGGGDAGPAPYGLLLSALVACTSITLRMYADKKGWQLGPVHVDASMFREADGERIERTIKVASGLTDEQRAKLAEIAEKTPVTRTVKRGTPIATTVVVM